MEEKKYELIKFSDGEFSLDVNVSPSEETVWLNRDQLALLFDRDVKTISKHISNSLKEECINSTVAKFATVQKEGNREVTREIEYFDLDVITSIGYRVKSKRGIQFRQWANKVLKQYLKKGFLINEDRCLVCNSSVLELSNEVRQLKNRMQNVEETVYQENEKLLYEGEILDAYTFIRKLFFLSKKEITIIDYYADKFLLSMLTDIKVNITIITSSNSYLNNIGLQENITIIKNDLIHDRFIIIDDEVYIIGTSFNEIGKKRFVIIKSNYLTKDKLLK
ncbi:MAG: virulence RhuM family protein [bacterium]|nr:virulence RhuM family protein [bacterium]